MTLPNVLTRSQTIVWAVAPERPYRPASILEQVGNTPLLDLSDLVGKPGVELYAKAEWFNPGGSVKDRAALRMIEDARPGRPVDSRSDPDRRHQRQYRHWLCDDRRGQRLHSSGW